MLSLEDSTEDSLDSNELSLEGSMLEEEESALEEDEASLEEASLEELSCLEEGAELADALERLSLEEAFPPQENRASVSNKRARRGFFMRPLSFLVGI